MDFEAAIKKCALEVGFHLVGITPVGLARDLNFARDWVERGFGGEMDYLKNPKRADLGKVFPEVKSVVCVGLIYNTELPYSTEVGKTEVGSQARDTARAWISRYAWGRDYHEVMREKLDRLRETIHKLAPGVETRVYVDTGPVVERAFARFSGIGWMGKNTCMINEQKGSWFFLGLILTNLKLELDLPAPDRCGSCMACLEACPTGALVEPYVMDASRCISYFTIELKGSIPEEFRPKIGANVFGCDICQDVCPWNGKSRVQVSGVRSQLQEGHQVSAISAQNSVFEDSEPVEENQLGGIVKNPTHVSFRGATGDEESRRGFTSRAGFLASLGMTSVRNAFQHPVRNVAVTSDPEFQPMILTKRDTSRQTSSPANPSAASQEQQTSDEVCRTPDTRNPKPSSLFNPPLELLASIRQEEFRTIFAHSPIKRTKYRGWLRNLCVVMGNSGEERFVPWLDRTARDHPDPMVREHAAWALSRLKKSEQRPEDARFSEH